MSASVASIVERRRVYRSWHPSCLGFLVTIIGELERALFFVVRNDRNAVSWAFPVTADETPHALAFSTGERCFAA
jgi:hypothetical protein